MSKTTHPLISIIIPVYNVEKYIERCFRSIEEQSFSDLECIFVDDCGQDNSMKILQDLIAKSEIKNQCKIFYHDKNRGLSAARNSGMDIAVGKYILFIDSDDYLLPDALRKLVEPLAHEEYDVVIGRYQRVFGQEIELSDVPDLSGKQPLMETIYTLRGKCALCVHNRLIRRELLEKNQIRFIEGILWEDNPFNIELFNCAGNICFLSEPTYAYVAREDSICSTVTEKHYTSWFNVLEAMEGTIKKSSEENLNSNIKLLGSFRLRALILSQRHGLRKQIEFLKYLRGKGFSEKEYEQLERKQKLLYVQHKMPGFLAVIYVAIFSFLYRTFVE